MKSTEGQTASSITDQQINLDNPAALSGGLSLDLIPIDYTHWSVTIRGSSSSTRFYTIPHDLFEAKLDYHPGGNISAQERVGKCHLRTRFSSKDRISGSWKPNHKRSFKALEEVWTSDSGIHASQPMLWSCTYRPGMGSHYTIRLNTANTPSDLILDCSVMGDRASIDVLPNAINSRNQLDELLTNLLAIFMRRTLELMDEAKKAGRYSSTSYADSSGSALSAVNGANASVSATIATM